MTWTQTIAGWQTVARDAVQMRGCGAELGRLLGAGDLVILDGPLGAGKTTLIQGIGRALTVRGQVTSPTFVIARRHPGHGPDLVHVDAYRLGSTFEVDDLDLDTDLDDCVLVVEWGTGRVESLSESRLQVTIGRGIGAGAVDEFDPSAGARDVLVVGIGPRWAELNLAPE